MRRRPAILLVLAGLSGATAGCGDGSDRPPTRSVAADDPATRACRGLQTPFRETCEGSFFQCREQAGEIIDDMDVEGRPPRDRISVAYVRTYWSETDRASQDAAGRGCRDGLPR